MDNAVDARHDVWLAADAAARMLKSDYARVKSWPLALTGYNHGIAGMVRAVRQLGTDDIGVIADRYQSPSFGFASRNFYAEFVAAATVFADRATIFPGVTPMPVLEYDEFLPGRFVSLLDLASLTRTGLETLVSLNPALDELVAQGQLLVPGTYPLRVPQGARGSFERAFAQLPPARTPVRQVSRTHRVARGDTLSGIAGRFGTTIANLQRANGLGRSTVIRVGQVLEVGSGGAWTPLVWTPSAAPRQVAATRGDGGRVHVIRAGETLYQIARRYGLTVAAIAAANDLMSPNHILVGMALTIPSLE
jgi:membrane-bound lytic murein transglycosylase D